MDAVSSFQHLVDNVESWKTGIRGLSAYASEKHKEFVEEYAQVLAHAKPKHMKSPSLTSIHSTHEETSHLASKQPTSLLPASDAPDLTEISPFEAGNRFLYTQVTRKRKLGTSLPSGASGPLRFRSKQMVIIRYDGHVQAELDNTFKSFGVARNNLRKGKNAHSASRGFRLPSLGDRRDRMLPSVERGHPRLPGTARAVPKLLVKEPSITNGEGEAFKADVAFVKADRLLEQSQNLCETAAHQFIRDGDCILELDNIIENLTEVLVLAQSAVDSLKIEEQEAKEKETTVADQQSLKRSVPSDWTDSNLNSISDKHLPRSCDISNDKQHPAIPAFTSSVSTPALAMDIEVDDDEDKSSIEIDISQFRRTTRGPPVGS